MAEKILKKGSVEGRVEPSRHRSGAEIMPEKGGIVRKRVVDAGERAAGILSEAEAQAERILSEADRVLNEAKAAADEEVRRAYKEGEAKGLAQVTQKLVTLQKLRDEFYRDAEPKMVRLILEIAEKVIGRLVQENPELIKSVVRQALEKSIGDRITVRVNPEDYRTVIEAQEDLRAAIDRTKRLSFREDDTVAKGGCVLETEVGTIDAQLGTQMEAIKKALTT